MRPFGGFEPWTRESSHNRPEANIADMAVMHARGVPVFLYNTLAPGQAAYIAGHCEATVAIVEDRGFLARMEAVRAQLPRLRRVVLIDGEPDPGEDWLIAWDAVLADPSLRYGFPREPLARLLGDAE